MKKMSYDLGFLGIAPAGQGGVGKVAIANESAMNASFLSEPLSDYATGWKSDEGQLEAELDFLAPGVRVPRKFEYFKGNNKDAFAMVADGSDVRSLFGEFAMVKTMDDTVDSHTVSKGFMTVIEKDSEMPGEREEKIRWLKKLLMRAEIYRAWLLLNSAATNTAKTWGSSSTPDKDLMAAITAFGDVVGIDANRVLFGSTAWQTRFGAYQAQETRNFIPPATPEALGSFLGADVMIGKSRYTSGSGKARIVSANTVLVFQGEKNASKDDPSTIKRFWTPENGGREYGVYIDETHAKLVKITVAHQSQIVATYGEGVQKLTIS